MLLSDTTVWGQLTVVKLQLAMSVEALGMVPGPAHSQPEMTLTFLQRLKSQLAPKIDS